jgi:hypothetical protein
MRQKRHILAEFCTLDKSIDMVELLDHFKSEAKLVGLDIDSNHVGLSWSIESTVTVWTVYEELPTNYVTEQQ